MIFDIDKNFDTQRFKESLNYQFEKIEKGVGELINSTMMMEEQHQIFNAFEAHMNHFSPKSRGSKYHQVVASFNPSDQIKPEDQINIINTWMESMGYDKTHHVIFKHSDTDKDHYHILCTSTYQDGKKINTFNDFKKNVQVTRKIEKNYGMAILPEESKTNVLTRSVDRYKYSNAIKKLPKSALVHPMFNPIGNKPYNGSDNELELEYQNDPILYKKVKDFLDLNNLARPSNASFIKSLLLQQISQSKTFEELKVKLKRERIYMRRVFNSKGSFLVFGKPEMGIYFKDYQLGPEFSESSIKKIISGEGVQNKTIYQDPASVNPKPMSFTYDQTSKYVKSIAKRAAKYNSDTEGFKNFLELYGIKVNMQFGKVGDTPNQLRSLSFEHNGYKIKASSLGLPGSKIRSLLNEPIPDDPNSNLLTTINRGKVKKKLYTSLYSANSLGQLISELNRRGVKASTIKTGSNRMKEVTDLNLSLGNDNFKLSDFKLNMPRIHQILEESHKRNLGVFINSNKDKITSFDKFKKDIFKKDKEIRELKSKKAGKRLIHNIRSITNNLKQIGSNDSSVAAYQEHLEDLKRLNYMK